MVVRGVGRSPYWAVAQLWHWATARWPWIDGTLLREGVNLDALNATRVINVIWSLFASQQDVVNGTEVARDELLVAVAKTLADSPMPDRATWGSKATMTAGQRAMLNQFGPPPGWKPPPPKTRPEEHTPTP